ncbi:hypothetical protein AUJ84_00055 [Candidatus Pacearchaeota archaeon CG1_02_32_132]|nr:MAG: hypothetical protein AUJ84_00055 [Candidatus Pacearchaeota archaeon CG1_02_32_132]
MFNVKKERFGKFVKFKLINSETREFVSIIPSFGANVNEIVLKKCQLISILDGDKTPSDMLNNEWFKGAKLSPFPNRIENGRYLFGNKIFRLPINVASENNAIHGFLYNKVFTLKDLFESKEKASIVLEYKYNEEENGFPFRFILTIAYTLNSKGLKVETEILNIGDKKMPIADGWHPHFTFNEQVDDLYLQMPTVEKIIVNERMIPTGKTEEFENFSQKSIISKTKFDTGFKIKTTGMVKTSLFSKKKNATIVLWQEAEKNKYNHLQVFIPPSRKSIAIEPMTSNTNAFNNKDGLIILKPNEAFSASYSVGLE